MAKQIEMEVNPPRAEEGTALVTGAKPSLSLPQNPTEMDLLGLALTNNAAIDVIERLSNLRDKAVERQSRIDFDEALNRCQSKLGRISADLENKQTSSRYASYAKLDKAIRPIYTAEGFSISFGEKDCPNPAKTRFVAYLSRAGVTREYTKDLTPSTKGPKGNDVMTPIHADGSADSYAKRYLLKDIFNIAIGEDDNDGNGKVDQDWLSEQISEIKRCETVEGTKAAFRTAAAIALDEIHDISAYRALKEAAQARGKELESK